MRNLRHCIAAITAFCAGLLLADEGGARPSGEFQVVNHLTSIVEVNPAPQMPLQDEEYLVLQVAGGVRIYVDVPATNAAADGLLRLYTMSPNSSRAIEPFELKGKTGRLIVAQAEAYPIGPNRLKVATNEERDRYLSVVEMAPLYQSETVAIEQLAAASKRLPKDKPVTGLQGELLNRIERAPHIGLLQYQPGDTLFTPIHEISILTDDGVQRVAIMPTDIEDRSDLQHHVATGNISGDGPARAGGYFYLPRRMAVVDLFKVASRQLGVRAVEVRAANDFTTSATAEGLLYLVLTRDGSPPRIATVPAKDQRYWSGPEPLFGIKEISALK